MSTPDSSTALFPADKALRTPLRGDLWALALAAAATTASLAQSWWLQSNPVYAFYYLAVVLSAVYGGIRGGVLATFVGAITAYFIYDTTPPGVRFTQLALFGLVSALLIVGVHRMRRMTVLLKESERRFSDLLGRVELLATMLDRDGRLTYCNQHFVTLTGWRRDEVIGRDVFTFLIPQEDVPAVRRLYARLLEDEAATSEVEILTKRGQRRLVRWSSTMLRAPSGEVIGAASIGQDVTDERRAQFANKLLASIVESTDDAILATTLDGTVTSWNPAAERIFGYPAGEILGRSSLLLAPEDRRAQAKANLARIARGERIQQLETVRIHRDGRRVDVSITLSPIFDSSGRIVGSSAIARDIGARKASERSLRDLSRQLFVAEDQERGRIAKELHDSTAQNLIAVMMSLESVRESVGARSDSAHETRQIEDCLAILESSTHDIRTLAYVLHPARFDEDGLVGALQHYVTGFVERTGIQIALDFPAHFDRLSPDVEMILFRIVQEALGNIHRHARTKTGAIRLSRDATRACLEVSDAGCGMPLDAAGNPAKVGVGIAGMRERMRQIGGSFDIVSGSQGTTLCATVPVGRATP
jgi:PAS domain S-box